VVVGGCTDITIAIDNVVLPCFTFVVAAASTKGSYALGSA
jgi:hypothetical protein